MTAIVGFAVQQRVLVLALFVIALVGGVFAFQQLNIEAYPDPTPPMVDVVTQAQGLSAEEIERYITIPLEVQLAGTRAPITAIRTISLYGLSDVKVQFTFDHTYEQAEQKILNQLSQMAPLPNGAQPVISPVSPIGEIYRYQLVGPPGFGVTDLKTLQDWVLQRRFKAVPGVIDVVGWGGKTKTYEVTVDLNRLLQYRLTLQQVVQALNNANLNVGGNTLDIGAQAAVVRGVGLIRSMDDIGSTMLTQAGGIPVFVRDVADVKVMHQPRLGIAGHDNEDDIVEGIVLMRRGEQSLPTIGRVEAEVKRINEADILPPGVQIKRIYDRKDLIGTTTSTVLHNMAIGILLIVVVQWLFLGNLRSALIVAATIPFALFFAVGLMVLRGESANLLSVGAIDFGLIVDATVLMVESIFRGLAERGSERLDAEHEGAATMIDVHSEKLELVVHAAARVNRSILFAALIIIASFVPLFTLSGVEGHIFSPMAKTYAYALAGGLLATFTVSPALSALLLPERVAETETALVRALHFVYRPVIRFFLARRALTLAGGAALLVVAGIGVRSMGLEFLPHLEEGNLWIRATMPTSISLQEGNGYVNRIRQIIKSFPEVETVVSQNGRPDDGTDATGFFNAEFFAPLKPTGEWRRGVDKEGLTHEMSRRLGSEFVGIEFNFSQYIQDNVEEAVSGVKGENSIKLIGNDLNQLAATANKIKSVLSTVPGVTDLAVFASLGQPTINIDIYREKAARYGLAPGDINAVIQTAIGGQAAGSLYEYGSDRHFPIVIRLAPEYRQSLDAIRGVMVGVADPNSGGVAQIPLSELAEIRLVSGASFIYREAQQRYIPIKFSVRGRDLGSAVLEAQRKVGEQVPLPPGFRMEWVGEFGNLQDAIGQVQKPLALVVVGGILLAPILILVFRPVLIGLFSRRGSGAAREGGLII
ncbi:MAG: efflux RND transporter permease subunit, partial [Proteobacteria bacterium]|nr:efflux RND transporter permease subunit [Pseudomonadota bacterium]